MKKIQSYLFISLAFLFLLPVSCKQEAKGVQEEINIDSEEFAGEAFGEGIKSSEYMEFAEVIEKLKNTEEVETVLKAKVADVCQAKGCWMNLTSSSSEEPLFVKFTDYAYFMPLDLTGAEVVIKGTTFREITSVDELKHYAEDEGLSQEEIDAITEPEEELKFMADGVVVTKR